MKAEDVNIIVKKKSSEKKLKPLTIGELAQLKSARKKLADFKPFKYKTSGEKEEYSRLTDIVERFTPRESVEAPAAVKKVLDNFDLLRKISGFVRKPIVYDEDEDLQQIAFARRAMDTIEMIVSDADIKISKAFKSRLSDVLELVNYNQYEKYKKMTDDELQPMYDAENDFEIYESTLENIADDFGMDIKFSKTGNYKLIRAKLNKPSKVVPIWLFNFLEKQE